MIADIVNRNPSLTANEIDPLKNSPLLIHMVKLPALLNKAGWNLDDIPTFMKEFSASKDKSSMLSLLCRIEDDTNVDEQDDEFYQNVSLSKAFVHDFTESPDVDDDDDDDDDSIDSIPFTEK